MLISGILSGLAGLLSCQTCLLVISTLLLLKIWLDYRNDHYKAVGIPGPTRYPFIGSSLGMIMKGVHWFESDNCDRYGSTCGLFENGVPVLATKDEHVMREILIKDFRSFTNRRPRAVLTDVIPLLLPMMRDEQWKRVRAAVMTIFTPAKLKQMTEPMTECCKVLCDEIGDRDIIDVKSKMSNFVLDAIGITVFGLKVDSKFRDIAGESTFHFVASFLLFCGFPKWILESLSQISLKANRPSILKLADKTVASLEKGQCHLISMLKEAELEENRNNQSDNAAIGEDKPNKLKRTYLTDKELLGQTITLFGAGFETVASALSMLLYGLAVNQEAQKKLYAEFLDVTRAQDGIDYDTVNNKLPYLGMCVAEALRMRHTMRSIDRIASKDVVISGINIPAKTYVTIPIDAMHRDPEIYPQPDSFIPERFSTEEKKKRNQCHYIPYGLGPRLCAGERMANFEMKIATYYVLCKYEIVTCDKTRPPQYSRVGMINAPIWLRVQKRCDIGRMARITFGCPTLEE